MSSSPKPSDSREAEHVTTPNTTEHHAGAKSHKPTAASERLPEHPHTSSSKKTPALPPGIACPKAIQAWTLTGYPIVDGKFLDSEGIVREVDPRETVTLGPPVIDLFWQNLYASDQEDLFHALRKSFVGTSTECLIKVVDVLRRAGGGIEVVSLSVARYSIMLITQSPVKRDDVMQMAGEVGL